MATTTAGNRFPAQAPMSAAALTMTAEDARLVLTDSEIAILLMALDTLEHQERGDLKDCCPDGEQEIRYRIRLCLRLRDRLETMPGRWV